MGRRPWSRKFADAFRGLRRSFRTQTSFAVHVAAAVAVVAVAAILQVSPVEWALLVLAIGGVLAAEVFNTAVESLARALDTGIHPRVRDALDMASAAVLVASLAAALVGMIVFIPHIVRWICSGWVPGAY
jgi:diacylglycerol kinase (ATP)